MKKEISRRRFLRGGAVTGAGLAAYGGISFITDPGRVFGANDRIRFGLIGCGDRGQEDLHAALACTNVECVALADVYTRRLDECAAIAPGAKTYRDFRGSRLQILTSNHFFGLKHRLIFWRDLAFVCFRVGAVNPAPKESNAIDTNIFAVRQRARYPYSRQSARGEPVGLQTAPRTVATVREYPPRAPVF